MDALTKAITITGSQQMLAHKVGATQQAVSLWLRRQPVGVGADWVIKVSEAVNFHVTPHQLRPDLYPHPDDGLPPELRGKHLMLETTDAGGNMRVEAIPQPNLQGAA